MGTAGVSFRALADRATQWWQRLLTRLRWWDNPHLPLGRRGELAAARYLCGKGLRIVAQGEADRLGELDLVAVERTGARRLVFVEVKTRSDDTLDHPAERVDLEKQRRLTKSALFFMKKHNLLEHPCRFDVVAVWWPIGGLKPTRIEHFEHAFEPVGRESFFS